MTDDLQARAPDFIIAGAMRSGTTALNLWLSRHPQVYMAPTKEVHFFDRKYDREWAWYAEHFADAQPGMVTGEATPNYIYHPEAVHRIACDVPDVKIVVVLRDPIDRAYSHYLHRVSHGGEDLDFSAALAAEEDRLAHGNEFARAHYSYADRGRYLAQLERLFEHFDRDAVSIHLFEDLRTSPHEVFTAVAEFIGVDPRHVPEEVGQKANAYQNFRSLQLRSLARYMPAPARRLVGRFNRVSIDDYPTLPPDAVERLAAEFDTERDALKRLVGRDLHEWSR